MYHIGWDVVDHAKTSSRRRNWYLIETDLIETFLHISLVRRKNQPILDVVTTYQLIPKWTNQLNTSLGHHNWYLNDTDVFETL